MKVEGGSEFEKKNINCQIEQEKGKRNSICALHHRLEKRFDLKNEGLEQTRAGSIISTSCQML